MRGRLGWWVNGWWVFWWFSGITLPLCRVLSPDVLKNLRSCLDCGRGTRSRWRAEGIPNHFSTQLHRDCEISDILITPTVEHWKQQDTATVRARSCEWPVRNVLRPLNGLHVCATRFDLSTGIWWKSLPKDLGNMCLGQRDAGSDKTRYSKRTPVNFGSPNPSVYTVVQ